MLTHAMDWTQIIITIISTLAGGGIGSYWTYRTQRQRVHLESEQHNDEVARQLRDELRGQIEELRQRVDHLEQEIEHERERRVQAQMDAAREAIYRSTNQLHRAISGDATASGESRIQARGEYVDDLKELKTVIDGAGVWLVEIVWTAWLPSREALTGWAKARCPERRRANGKCRCRRERRYAPEEAAQLRGEAVPA